jgi:hypothetical protein
VGDQDLADHLSSSQG